MPDGSNERAQQIEKRIDPQVSGAIALSGSGGALSIAPQNMGEMFEFAKMMAVSGPCVRPAFRGSPGACLAIALQAFRTGADPFAVANKAYITTSRAGDEQIAYEAQYIHAVLNNSGKLARRLRATYDGDGMGRRCKIIGHVVGEDEPLEYESPTIGEIAVKNSPLWKGDPDQQLFYYSTRAWGRRHLPEVLLGMYTPDEIRGEVIDITPGSVPARPRPEDFAASAAAEAEPVFEIVDFFGEAQEFSRASEAQDALLEMIAKARSLKTLEGIWESNLGTVSEIETALGRDADDSLNSAYIAAKIAFEQDPGIRQDRPAAGAQPSDPARGATQAQSRSVAASTAEFDSADAGSSPAATSTSADPAGHTEHPEGEETPTLSSERSRTQELPAAGAATPAAAEKTPNTPNERPRDAPKQASHAPRDEKFWSQSKFELPETTKPKELLYYTQQYLRQCRDQIDINGIETDNATRFQQLSPNDRREANDLIAQRRREIG